MTLPILQAEFMLLPNFSTLPASLPLGTILPRSPHHDLPDPKTPLNLTSTPAIAPSQTSTQTLSPFHFTTTSSHGTSFNISSNIPILSSIGGSLGFTHTRDLSLSVSAPEVLRETFDPSPSWILSALKGSSLVEEYTHAKFRPGVFLVTGRMVVTGKGGGARIEIGRGKKDGGEAGVSADLSAIGAPVGVGVKGEGGRGEETGMEFTQEGEWVVAYRVLKVRLRRDGGLKRVEEFNRFALMGERIGETEERRAGEELEKEWEIEGFTAGMMEEVEMKDEGEEYEDE